MDDRARRERQRTAGDAPPRARRRESRRRADLGDDQAVRHDHRSEHETDADRHLHPERRTRERRQARVDRKERGEPEPAQADDPATVELGRSANQASLTGSHIAVKAAAD